MISRASGCMVSNPITCCSVMRWASTPRGMECPQHKKTEGAFRPLERGFRLYLSSLLPVQILASHSCLPLISPLSMPPWCLPTALAQVGAIDPTSAQQGPHDPGILVRHRHGRPIPPATREQPLYPLAATICFPLHPAQRRPGSMDQQLAYVAIPPLADP